MNISSIVVTTKPEHLEEVETLLLESGLCDIHFKDEKGRIIVTVEGDDDGDESKKLKIIAELPHVANAVFSYTYTDDS
jgi:nitrate reductase NapD